MGVYRHMDALNPSLRRPNNRPKLSTLSPTLDLTIPDDPSAGQIPTANEQWSGWAS